MANCPLFYGPVTKESWEFIKANSETNRGSLKNSRKSSPYVSQTSEKSIRMTGKAYVQS